MADTQLLILIKKNKKKKGRKITINYTPKWSKTQKKKNTKQPPFNSYGRRGEPPISLSSANYGAASLPEAGQAPPT